jgi:hypothetical protein
MRHRFESRPGQWQTIGKCPTPSTTDARNAAPGKHLPPCPRTAEGLAKRQIITRSISEVEQQPRGVFDQFLDANQKTDRLTAIDDAVVVG